jgi:hypothetical protein
LNNFTAFLEISCSPSLTDALIKYTLEAIENSPFAIKDIYIFHLSTKYLQET